jgi:hypothetical protein
MAGREGYSLVTSMSPISFEMVARSDLKRPEQPTGLDSGMNQNYGMPIESGAGILATRCFESAACRAAMAKAGEFDAGVRF